MKSSQFVPQEENIAAMLRLTSIGETSAASGRRGPGSAAARDVRAGLKTIYQPNWMVAPVRPLPFWTAWPLVFLPNWNRP